ncbi:hypothetical protein ABW19_dt0203699 [Dactylella cylindrospora]|nr:hypothetical protein ABW19_dt0203699 [Dactylella cylindrospora]
MQLGIAIVCLESMRSNEIKDDLCCFLSFYENKEFEKLKRIYSIEIFKIYIYGGARVAKGSKVTAYICPPVRFCASRILSTKASPFRSTLGPQSINHFKSVCCRLNLSKSRIPP